MRIYPEVTVDSEFKQLGDAGYTGSLNDRQFSFLRTSGLTGSLTDMMYQYRNDPIGALFTVEGRTGWRYPLTLDTLFQDAAGTTPVTAPGDPVGLVLDTSKGLALGPEKAAIATAATVTGTNPGAPAGKFLCRRAVDATQFYRVEFGIGAFTPNATVVLSITIEADALETGNFAIWAGPTVFNIGGPGDYTIRVPADSVGKAFIQPNPGNSFLLTIHSVRELPGNHRTQSTALNRPTYQVDSDGKPYLAYNGSNSSMATAPFAWGSDKATICVGVRKLSDAASAAFLEFSPSIPANAGAFAWFAPGTSGTANYLWRSRGSASQVDVSYTNAAIAAPVTNVLTGIGDIAGDSAILRVNGTQVASSAIDQGSGNYGTYQLFWGARAGTSLFFNGREYPSIGINAALTASELALVEAWVTARTGTLG